MKIDPATALSRLESSPGALLEAVGQLDLTQVESAAVEGSWTPKDLLGHVESWERALLEPLERYTSGGSFVPEDIPDHDAWNARQSEGWKDLPLEQVMERLTNTRTALLDALNRLTPTQWEPLLPAPWGGVETIAEMVSGLAWHEREHTKSLRDQS